MKPLIHAYHYRLVLLLVGTGLYFMANLQRVAIPGSIFNTLQQELQLDAPAVTTLGAAFMYVYAWNQLLIGVLVERYGGARVITAGALLFCIGSLMFPFLQTPFWLYFSRALTGLGASSIYLSQIKEVKRTFSDKNFSFALSALVLAGYTGGIAANAPFAVGAQVIGWQMLLVIIAIISFLFYMLFLATSTRIKFPKVRREIQFSFMPFLHLLRKRQNVYIFLFSGINFGQYYVLQTVIGKKFLEDFCRMSSSVAGWILSLMAIISAVAGLLFAIASRLSGNRRQIFLRFAGVMGILVFSGITLGLCFNWHSPLIAILMCFTALTSGIATITIPLLYETNPSNASGSAVCLMNFASYIIVAILGNLVGVLMNIREPQTLESGLIIYGRYSYMAVFGVILLLSCVSTFCAWHCREMTQKRANI